MHAAYHAHAWQGVTGCTHRRDLALRARLYVFSQWLVPELHTHPQLGEGVRGVGFLLSLVAVSGAGRARELHAGDVDDAAIARLHGLALDDGIAEQTKSVSHPADFVFLVFSFLVESLFLTYTNVFY